MCFSAPASFTASAVLSVIGIALVRRVYQKREKRFYPLAIAPLIFAIQQAAEGAVWLSLPKPSIGTWIFLFFAYCFWNTWGPFALWSAEKQAKRRQWMIFFLGIGIATSLLLATLIPETVATHYGCSIRYVKTDSTFSELTLSALALLYVASTVGSFLASSLKYSSFLGLLFLFGATVFNLIDVHFFISMWCFYMAIASIAFFWFICKNESRKG